MFFKQLLHEEKSCLSYLIGCSSRGVVAVIDPQIDITPYITIAKKYNLKITDIIETHVQADHLSGAQKLAEKTGAPVYFHESAPILFLHKKLKDGDNLSVGNRSIQIIHTPGHTDDSICLLVDEWFFLTGDTLFVGDVGRVDLSLTDRINDIPKKARKLYDSIFEKLLNHPDYIEIYPGHFGGSVCGKHMDGKPNSTIGREKRANYALQVKSKADFIKLITTDVPPPPDDYRRIKRENIGYREGGETI